MGLSARGIAKELKVSHTAVNKAAESGRIHREKDGTFDLAKVKREWDRNADFHQQQRGAPKPPANESRLNIEDEHSSTDPKLKDVQLFREKIKARLEKLKLDEAEGRLVDAQETKQAWAKLITSARSAILLLPAKLAPRVAAVSDVRECQAVIEKEVRALLTGLSEYE